MSHDLTPKANKTGQDSPILRKAIGETYQNQNDFVKAIAQFKLAVQLQPNDAAIHKDLIACFDATQDKAAAISQLLKLIDVEQHDLTLYQQLADRLKDNEAEAERATTSIVESAPNEAETSCGIGSERRQSQNRWSEAISAMGTGSRNCGKLEPTGLLKLAGLHNCTKSNGMRPGNRFGNSIKPTGRSDLATCETKRVSSKDLDAEIEFGKE